MKIINPHVQFKEFNDPKQNKDNKTNLMCILTKLLKTSNHEKKKARGKKNTYVEDKDKNYHRFLIRNYACESTSQHRDISIY